MQSRSGGVYTVAVTADYMYRWRGIVFAFHKNEYDQWVCTEYRTGWQVKKVSGRNKPDIDLLVSMFRPNAHEQINSEAAAAIAATGEVNTIDFAVSSLPLLDPNEKEPAPEQTFFDFAPTVA